MKISQFFFPITLCLVAFSTFNYSYQIECISIENDGYITLKIWNSKQGKNYKSEQARKNAVHAILFSGVPPSTNSCITQKPMLADLKAQKNFERIEKDFFGKNGAWSKYTRMSETQNALHKVYQVTIAKNLLRKDLEDQKIIKPLNSGF